MCSHCLTAGNFHGPAVSLCKGKTTFEGVVNGKDAVLQANSKPYPVGQVCYSKDYGPILDTHQLLDQREPCGISIGLFGYFPIIVDCDTRPA